MIATDTPNPVSAREDDPFAPRPKRKLPADPAVLMRHSRWFIDSGRPLMALVIARVAIELHLRELATACQTGQRNRYMTYIAGRLHDVGVLSYSDVGTVIFLNNHLGLAIHTAVCKKEPTELVEKVANFIDATRGRSRPE